MIPKNKIISVLHPYVNKKGGAVKMMIYLSNLLKKEGNNVKLYTFSYDKDLFNKENFVPNAKGQNGKINFEIVDISKKFGTSSYLSQGEKKRGKFRMMFEIAYKIRKSDYIIVGNSPMQFVAVISKIFFCSKAKLIWWHHHYPWYYSENTNFLVLTKRFLEKLSIKFFDEVIANSEYLRHSLKKVYSVNAKVLYPLVDEEFENVKFGSEDFRNKCKKSNTIFTYGRRVRGKNIEQIFKTYEYLQSKNLGVELLIGGVGEELDDMKAKNGKLKGIKFLGLLDDVSIIENLQKSLIFLFPSKIDSFGITILEAGYLGVPTIAFALNGAYELVDNGQSGFLVNSSDEFNKKTYELLTYYMLCKSFSKKAREKSVSFNKLRFRRELSEIFKVNKKGELS